MEREQNAISIIMEASFISDESVASLTVFILVEGGDRQAEGLVNLGRSNSVEEYAACKSRHLS